MLGKFRRYQQIAELEGRQRTAKALENDISRRQRVPIAVIDDQPFPPQNILQNNGYDIRVLGDIKNLNEVEGFSIILCDLNGVGRYLDAKYQGAHIIEEIKRNHPEKFVGAYTGGGVDNEVIERANEAADFFIKKDEDVGEWRSKLDGILVLITNPIYVWKRQRFALVDADVETLDILKLEDAFVKSILNENELHFIGAVQDLGIGKDARAIAQSLVASGIFGIMFG